MSEEEREGKKEGGEGPEGDRSGVITPFYATNLSGDQHHRPEADRPLMLLTMLLATTSLLLPPPHPTRYSVMQHAQPRAAARAA